MATTKITTTGITDSSVSNAKLGTDISAAKLTAGTIDGDRLPSPNLTIKGDTTAGKLILNCETNAHGIGIQSPLHASAASYTLTLPTTDGNASEYLQTDGNGVLTWAEAGGGSWNLISAQTASADNEIEFTDSHFTSTYDVYKVVISDTIAGTDGSDFRMRVSQSGSYNTTTDYEWATDYLWYNDQARYGANNGTAFEFTYVATGNAVGETINSEVTIYNPLSTNNYKQVEATTMYISSTGIAYRSDLCGRFTAAYGTPLDAFKFYMSTGTITSGLFVLYGLSKS